MKRALITGITGQDGGYLATLRCCHGRLVRSAFIQPSDFVASGGAWPVERQSRHHTPQIPSQ